MSKILFQIPNCDSYFITKGDKNLLQDVPGFSAQNATVY